MQKKTQKVTKNFNVAFVQPAGQKKQKNKQTP